MTLPLRVDGRPLRPPRKTPTTGVRRPEWSDYTVKVPVQCTHCVLAAYERATAGRGAYDGIRQARRKRKQGDEILLLCSEHAHIQQDQDLIDYPSGESTGKKGQSGQRYIA